MISDSDFTVEIGAGVPLRAGDDWDVVIPLEAAFGEPFTWPSGASARLHLRDKPSAASPLLALSTAESELVLEAGGLRLTATAAQTAALPAAPLVFDVEVTVAGKRDTFIAGKIFVGQKITRGATL